MIRNFVLLTGLAALAACDMPGPQIGGGIGAQGPVKVALMVPAGSGDNQREELAQSIVNAARLAQQDLTSVEVELTVYPTAGDPDQATAAAQQALSEGAEVILGPLFSTSATAVAPVASARGVQVLSFSNNTQIAGDNLYVLGNTFDNTARRIVGYAAAQGVTDLAIVRPEGPEGELAGQAIANAAAAVGSQIVSVSAYPLSVQGITDTIPDAAKAVRGSGAMAVVLTDGPTGGLTFVAETLRGLGVRKEAVRFIGLQRWDTSPQAMAQPGLDAGWFAASDPLLAQQFRNRYEANYGALPHPLASLGYDGVAAIGALVAEARAEGRNDAFTPARITKPAGFAGVGGIFRLLPDGRNERALAIVEVIEGTAQAIDPAPRSFVTPGS